MNQQCTFFIFNAHWRRFRKSLSIIFAVQYERVINIQWCDLLWVGQLCSSIRTQFFKASTIWKKEKKLIIIKRTRPILRNVGKARRSSRRCYDCRYNSCYSCRESEMYNILHCSVRDESDCQWNWLWRRQWRRRRDVII